MADKSVGELIAAQSVTPTDLFVLEQNGTAKKLTGQVLENWLVSFADGHGGIHSIKKLSTSGLVDTYRITLADTTTFDFDVTNGRSITGISKTSTSGLVDTYTITYNNGPASTFTVKNGEKGDKGDNVYVWIKYASQEPTESSHSIGDIPDDWIGIYSGNASTAPTDWKQYKWFKHKGEHGDTGDPATLVSTEIVYQSSDSGTIIPSGTWLTFVPSVPQGQYLWTRTTQHYNSGDPVVAYSVSRFGIDGTGSVSSVADVPPDSNGNVSLTPDDIGADAKQKYGKLVVFGDSLGQGVNNDNYSFVNVLAESGVFGSVVKACVGGATIGPYQTDSAAAGYSLVEQIERHSSDVISADIIMLEYGGNDIFSLLAGNVTIGSADDSAAAVTICGYMKKALERIRALNPDARIIWLAFAWNSFAYLRDRNGTDFADAELLFEATALKLARPYLSSVIPIMDGASASDYSNDGMHPNTDGHKYIANKILHNIFVPADFPPLFRPMTMTGDIFTASNLAFDGEFQAIHKLLVAGVSVEITYQFEAGSELRLHPHMYNSYDMLFNVVVTSDCISFYDLFVIWNADGSIEMKLKPAAKAYAHNLLDNSDFRNPVNQRGITSGASIAAYSYSIDRWSNQTSEARSFTLSASGIGLPVATTLIQKIENIQAGKVVTFAIKPSDGAIATLTGTVEYASDGAWMRLASINHSFGDMYIDTMNGVVNVAVYNTKVITIQWAALYEGTYTAETIPEYQPKGYGAELAECQRYYQIRSANNIAAVDMRPTMRLSSPTITSVTGGYAYSADL